MRKPAAEKTTTTAAKPAAKARPAKPAAKAAAAPAAKPPAKAAVRPAEKAAAKPAARPSVKAAAKPAPKAAGPAVKKSAPVKPAPKSSRKPAPKKGASAPDGAGEPVREKARKARLVRDSFTMPEHEYEVLGQVKKACLKAGFDIKKSELLRIGVALISQMDLATLRSVLASLPQLKTGRPKSA